MDGFDIFAVIQDFNQLPSAERLPNQQQLRTVTDVNALEDLRDCVDHAISTMEVDLEFRTDEGADNHWEHRARRALAAHKLCRNLIDQRLRSIKKSASASKAGDVLTKAAIDAENKRSKSIRQMIEFANRQSFLVHFHNVVRDELDADKFKELVARAKDAHKEAAHQEIPANIELEAHVAN